MIGSKESTELLIRLGCSTAAAKVRRKWSDNDKIQQHVRRLAKMLAAEMNNWADERL